MTNNKTVWLSGNQLHALSLTLIALLLTITVAVVNKELGTNIQMQQVMDTANALERQLADLNSSIGAINDSLIKNLDAYFYANQKECSYLVTYATPYYLMQNGTTSSLDYWGLNVTKTETFANGNLTTGGLIETKEVLWNTSIVLLNNVFVIQNYNGTYNMFSNAGAFSVPILTADPSAGLLLLTSPSGGNLWYNNADDHMKYWNGTAIVTLPGIGGGGQSVTLPFTYTIYAVSGTYYAETMTGTIPYSGTNFTNVRRQALASISQGRIMYPSPAYYTANTLTTKSFIGEVGAGMNKTEWIRSADVILLNYTEQVGNNANQQRCSLESLTLDGGSNAYTTDIVYIAQLKDSIFKDLHIKAATRNAFYLTGTASYKSFWNTFRDILFDNQAGINTGSAFNMTSTAIDSLIDNAWGNNYEYGISTDGADDWTVNHYWIAICKTFINFQASSWIGGWFFTNTWLDMGSTAATGHAVILNASAGSIGDISFRDVFVIDSGGYTNYDIFKLDGNGANYVQDCLFSNLHGYPTRTNSAIFNATTNQVIRAWVQYNFMTGATNRYVNMNMTRVYGDLYG